MPFCKPASPRKHAPSWACPVSRWSSTCTARWSGWTSRPPPTRGAMTGSDPKGTASKSSLFQHIKDAARRLKVETYALYLACRDPRTPWYAKAWAVLVVAYAFSPIDLIPDFVPVLGYLDDLVIIPLGIWLALRMIPPAVMADA